MNNRPPEKLPDPGYSIAKHYSANWTAAAKLVLKIPRQLTPCISPATLRSTPSGSSRRTLRYLLHLHREAHRLFAKKTATVTQPEAMPKHRKSPRTRKSFRSGHKLPSRYPPRRPRSARAGTGRVFPRLSVASEPHFYVSPELLAQQFRPSLASWDCRSSAIPLLAPNQRHP